MLKTSSGGSTLVFENITTESGSWKPCRVVKQAFSQRWRSLKSSDGYPTENWWWFRHLPQKSVKANFLLDDVANPYQKNIVKLVVSKPITKWWKPRTSRVFITTSNKIKYMVFSVCSTIELKVFPFFFGLPGRLLEQWPVTFLPLGKNALRRKQSTRSYHPTGSQANIGIWKYAFKSQIRS